MQVIENLKVKEKLYIEKLENGLTVMVIPKPGIQKKYMIWGTNYGSNDSEFIVPGKSLVHQTRGATDAGLIIQMERSRILGNDFF